MPQKLSTKRATFSPAYIPRVLLFGLCLLLAGAGVTAQAPDGEILNGSELVEGFDIGINSSGGKTDWLSREPDYLKMAFPANQSWAAMFITVGPPTDPPRPSMDFSAFKTLSLEMRGAEGGEKVEVGIKTNTQPDNGRETKVTYTLEPNWVTYKIPLYRFKGADPKHLYVVTEFVYNGRTPQTVYVRNIKYIK